MSKLKDNGDGFLHRWSQRKLALQQGGETVEDTPAAAEAAPPAGMLANETVPAESPDAAAAKELTDADMPALDSLDEHSDYSGFLSPRVSEVLRRQALRKLFHLPAFNVTDGLNDYDEDYTRGNVLSKMVADRMMAGRNEAPLSPEAGSEPGPENRNAEPTAVPDAAGESDVDQSPADETDLES
jgi:hypothetical protein